MVIRLLILFFVSISSWAADTTATGSTSSATPPTTPQNKPQVQIAADYYQKIGIPPINKPWGPNDYLQAAAVLTTVAQRNPSYLPNYENKVAEPYMRHIANGQNLYQVLSFATTKQQRIDLMILYLDGIQRLLTIYQQVLSKTTPYYTEWLDLIALSSYLTALSAPELQYPMPNSNGPQADPYAAKREAANILLTAMVNPIITGLQTVPRLPPVLAGKFVQQLNHSMPIYAQLLPLSAQQQIYEALLVASRQVKDQELLAGIQKLVALFNTTRQP